MKKRLASVMLTLCVALTIFPISALATEETPETDNQTTESSKVETIGEPSAVEGEAEKQTPSTKISEPTRSSSTASGACGENATWKLENETLIISGAGDMDGYYYNPNDPDDDSVPGCKKAPWYSLRDQIKTVVINDGISSIGMSAFFGCSQLTNVTIPNSVHLIDAYAFSGCSSLASITLPNGITDIHPYTFEGCVNLTEVAIPDSVTTIWAGSFGGCSSLTSITLPPNLTSVGDHSFSYCGNLSTIKLPNNVTRIENHAFAYCVKLKSATIPHSVEYIGWNAFTHCYELADVYYGGSKKDWNSINKDDNERLEADDITIHCADGEINKVLDEISIKKTTIYLRPWIGKKTTDIEVNWGWKLFQEDATQRNNWQDLAVTGLCLSRAVEISENDGKDLLRKLGFEQTDSQNYNFGEWNPAVVFGHKTITLYSGKKQHIFVLVIRGTSDGGDVGVDASILINQASVFVNNINTQFEAFIEKKCGLSFKDVVKDNSKIYVTGHSLGGAIANIITAQKLNEKYSASNVFTYTFGCPTVLTSKDGANNGTKNILNIINREDMVTTIPFSPNWPVYGCRYGEDKVFHRDWYTSVGFYDRFLELTEKNYSYDPLGIGGTNAHATDVYMAYLLTINRITKRNITIVAVRCPVDAEIFDSSGRLVAKIKNNNVENIVSEKIYIHIDNDEKLMYISDDDKYTIKLTGTDEGTMEYSVQNVDLIESKLISEKVFSNVSLNDGKQMISYLNVENEKTNGTDTSKIQLFVSDERGNLSKEVLSDGKGTEVPIIDASDNSGDSNPGNNANISDNHNDNTQAANVSTTDTINQSKKAPNTGDESSVIWFYVMGLLVLYICVVLKWHGYIHI